MRKRLALLCLVACASLVSAAPAQPGKKAPAPKEEAKPDAAKAGKLETEKAGAAAAGDAAAPATGTDDLGAPPPKDVAEQKPEQKPSPLTPKPEEFPSGVAKPPPFEYDKLLGDIAALRSRVAALTTIPTGAATSQCASRAAEMPGFQRVAPSLCSPSNAVNDRRSTASCSRASTPRACVWESSGCPTPSANVSQRTRSSSLLLPCCE